VSFIEGPDRAQINLLPPSIEDYIAPEALVRVVDAFVDSLDLSELGFEPPSGPSFGLRRQQSAGPEKKRESCQWQLTTMSGPIGAAPAE
jgi:transposase